MTVSQVLSSERTEMFRDVVPFPSAWKSTDLGGKDKVSRRLTPQMLDAVDELLEKTGHLDPHGVSRAQFDHPALNGFLRSVFDEIMNGRGFTIITGLSPDKYSHEQLERIYWGFGTHWGNAVVQSPRGDRIGHVRYEPPTPGRAQRAYTSAGELVAHCDAHEIVGLMCLQRARAGGASGLMSTLAAHNELLEKRPDLLEPLYEGYQFMTREALLRGQELTPYKVPVFSQINGVLSCYYNRAYIYGAEKYTGQLPEKLREAMDFLNEFFTRDDVNFEFMLEPGEMSVWQNFTVIHARTHYENDEDPQYQRHLLRLWLSVPNGRPMIPVYHRDLVAGA